MTDDEQSRLSFYLDNYNNIVQRVGDAGVATAIVQEIGKDHRVDKMNGARNSRPNNGAGYNVNATTKQLQYLERLGVKFDKDISKKEASELIDNAVMEENVPA